MSERDGEGLRENGGCLRGTEEAWEGRRLPEKVGRPDKNEGGLRGTEEA